MNGNLIRGRNDKKRILDSGTWREECKEALEMFLSAGVDGAFNRVSIWDSCFDRSVEAAEDIEKGGSRVIEHG